MSAETMTLEEAAEALLCESTDTVQEMLREGLLPGIKPGRRWVIPRTAFWEAVNQMAVREALVRAQAKGFSAQVVPIPKQKSREQSRLR